MGDGDEVGPDPAQRVAQVDLRTAARPGNQVEPALQPDHAARIPSGEEPRSLDVLSTPRDLRFAPEQHPSGERVELRIVVAAPHGAELARPDVPPVQRRRIGVGGEPVRERSERSAPAQPPAVCKGGVLSGGLFSRERRRNRQRIRAARNQRQQSNQPRDAAEQPPHRLTAPAAQRRRRCASARCRDRKSCRSPPDRAAP